MKIKIISCSGEKYWYKDSIGKEFTVIDDPKDDNTYKIYPNGNYIDKSDCIQVCDYEDKTKKIYFKVYQDIENMKGCTYITTPEDFMHNYKDQVKEAVECGDDLFPVIEIVMMTEEEYFSLEEFQGY